MKNDIRKQLIAVVACCFCAFGGALAQPVRTLIESIDLKCYRIEGDIRPLNLPLTLEHLNPVIRELGAPPERVIVREPQQLCVPVMKNGRLPDPMVLDFIAYLDLKCYRIESDITFLGLPLLLDHLNPVFIDFGIPPENVVMLDPQQLCVPVAENGRIPPPQVLHFVENVDLKCYGIQSDVQTLELPLVLDHLNPVLQEMGAPPENVIVHEPQQLCVPVAKNGRIPPADVLPYVSFLDLKKYKIESDIPSLDIPLHLDHLNPVFRQFGVPPEDVIVREPQQLGVPVAKNGRFPPADW